MSTQNVAKLSSAVHELSCVQRKKQTQRKRLQSDTARTPNIKKLVCFVRNYCYLFIYSSSIYLFIIIIHHLFITHRSCYIHCTDTSITFSEQTYSLRSSTKEYTSRKCRSLRFVHWLTLHTLNIHLLTYLLTYLLIYSLTKIAYFHIKQVSIIQKFQLYLLSLHCTLPRLQLCFN